jgi:hypothetical protein
MAGLLMALDGLELVLSRTALLDIFVMFWVLAAFGLLIIDRDRTRARLATAADAAAPGSYLAMSDVARDMAADANVETSASRLNERLGPARQAIRSPQEIAGFFGDLEMVDPGLVQLPQWRPDLGYAGPVEGITISAYCGIARKR